MAYAEIDVHLDEHPSNAWMELDDLGLHMCGILYCNRNLTDGFIPEVQVRKFGASGKGSRVVKRLIENGVWRAGVRARGGVEEPGYWILGYLEHNYSKAEIEAKMEAKRAAGQRGGKLSREVSGEADTRGRASPAPRVSGEPSVSVPAAVPAAPSDLHLQGDIKILSENPTDAPTAVTPVDNPKPAQEEFKLDGEPAPEPGTPLQAVYQHYVAAWKRHHSRGAAPLLGEKRARYVKARLKEGFSVETLCDACDGVFLTPFNMGENEQRKHYTDLDLVCRDARHVEEFAATAATHRARATRSTAPLEFAVHPVGDLAAAEEFRGKFDDMFAEMSRNAMPSYLREVVEADAVRGADVRLPARPTGTDEGEDG